MHWSDFFWPVPTGSTWYRLELVGLGTGRTDWFRLESGWKNWRIFLSFGLYCDPKFLIRIQLVPIGTCRVQQRPQLTMAPSHESRDRAPSAAPLPLMKHKTERSAMSLPPLPHFHKTGMKTTHRNTSNRGVLSCLVPFHSTEHGNTPTLHVVCVQCPSTSSMTREWGRISSLSLSSVLVNVSRVYHHTSTTLKNKHTYSFLMTVP